MPDGSRLDLPAGTEVQRLGDRFAMTLPDGTHLDVDPPRFERSTYEVSALPPPHRRGERGPTSYYVSRTSPCEQGAWDSPHDDGEPLFTIVLEEPEDPWILPELHGPAAWNLDEASG